MVGYIIAYQVGNILYMNSVMLVTLKEDDTTGQLPSMLFITCV